MTEGRRKIKDKLSKTPILRRLTHNTGLKVLSLIFAIVLWSVVMAKTNPTRTKVIYDVPVEITGLNSLSDRGLSLRGATGDLPGAVDIYLEVPMNDLSRASSDNVHAILDFSRISATGKHTLPLNITSAYGKSTSSTVSSVNVEIESQVTSIVPVQVSTLGTLADGYRLGKVVSTPAQFQVKGPETDVNRVAAAIVQMDLTGLTSDYNRSLVYTLVDENFVPVDSMSITSNIGNSVGVSASVYPVIEVPITYNSSIVDAPAEGYTLDGVEITPKTVRIAAPESVLKTITAIPITSLSVADATQTFTSTIALTRFSDVVWMDISEVSATIKISEKTETKTFSGLPVTYRNLGTGLKANLFDAACDVEITLPRSKLQILTVEDIEVYVDLNGYTADGEITAPVFVHVRTDAAFTATPNQDKIVIRVSNA